MFTRMFHRSQRQKLVRMHARRQYVRPIVINSAVATLLLASVLRVGVIQAATPLAAQADTPAVQVLSTLAPGASTSATVATTTIHPTSSQTETSIPACTRNASLADVSPLDLAATAGTGLTQVVDQTRHYAVYGSNSNDLVHQIISCAPSSDGSDNAEFTAETVYRLDWQYSVTTGSDGQCSLSAVKVGMHLAIIMPAWQPNPAANTTFVAHWQNFMTNLYTHESGHVAIDQQYAQSLTANLENFPVSDCTTIKQSAANLIDSVVNTLNQANDTYDATTNHGATQGAILPSN